MDGLNRMLSPSGTQIEDLPSCLIIHILVRLPIKSLAVSRLVSKNWSLLVSDPLFVQLHSARSASYLFRRKSGELRKFCCTTLVQNIPGENFEFEANVTLPDSEFTCVNSSNGLLCLENCKSRDEIYVCNPILGQYVTIPIDNTNKNTILSVLGFCSRSNQFKVLQISNGSSKGNAPYMAEIYTIGNGTRRWKSLGIAPSCPGSGSVNSYVNGSIHWIDIESHNILYFNFESEQFGSLPLPRAWSDGISPKFNRVRAVAGDGCLWIHAHDSSYEARLRQVWIMKEYGVEESWTMIFWLSYLQHYLAIDELRPLPRGVYGLIVHGDPGAVYNPSFVSLQDVARGERFI